MKVRKLFLMLFIAVPLIVMILVGLLAGIFQLKRDIAVSANTLLRFSADISAASWQVARKAARLAESSCTDTLKELSRTRAFTPYVRDIGFLENGDIMSPEPNAIIFPGWQGFLYLLLIRNGGCDLSVVWPKDPIALLWFM
ncbi:hypothetical protein FE138_14580 [Salmonella enterica]|nr:hypothetical protein [Salmonella enterica]